jgi:hypothetical protein
MRCLTQCLTIVALLGIAGFAVAGTFQADRGPVVNQEVPEVPLIPTLAPWDVQFSFDASTPTGGLSLVGAEFDGTYFYSNRWNTTDIFQYDIDGNLLKTFSIPGVSNLRDLAYDGTFFYGGAAGGTIWIMDFDCEVLIGTINGGFQSRAIAYNEDDDTF